MAEESLPMIRIGVICDVHGTQGSFTRFIADKFLCDPSTLVETREGTRSIDLSIHGRRCHFFDYLPVGQFRSDYVDALCIADNIRDDALESYESHLEYVLKTPH